LTKPIKWLVCRLTEGGRHKVIVIIQGGFPMARKTIEKNKIEKKQEIELTPDEIADLLTGGCDNLGMS
jgi:hypothetical protein